MAVSRGPLLAREIKNEIGSSRGSSTPTSGGRGGTPNCGPNARWNGTRCVSTAMDIETRRALDKVDWNAVGRLMGGTGAPSTGPLTSTQRGEMGINAGEMARRSAWDKMTAQEQADALSKVDYDALGRLMGISGAGGGGGATTTTPAAPKAPAATTTTGAAPAGAMTQDEITKQLLDALGGIEAFARNDINAAGDALLKSLGAYDPQAQFNLAQPSVGVPAANLAGYLGYVGGSPAQVEGAQQYAQGLTDAFLGDVNRYQTGSAQAQDVWRGRQADVARQNQAKALMNLALNTMATRLGIRTGEAARRQNQLDTALQLALQYGRPTGQGTGGLSFGAPNISYQTVTLPNGQMVQLPSTLFGGF